LANLVLLVEITDFPVGKGPEKQVLTKNMNSLWNTHRTCSLQQQDYSTVLLK
jgi:hypothetical protein